MQSLFKPQVLGLHVAGKVIKKANKQKKLKATGSARFWDLSSQKLSLILNITRTEDNLNKKGSLFLFMSYHLQEGHT